MDRRRFLKVTAITGTTPALAGCGNPENQIVRFIPDEELVPGIAVWKPSVCPLCAAGCGVIARVMDGDAEVFRKGQPGVTRMGLVRKLEGDPAHPMSRGRLCVRGQAAVQVTYHPDRLVAPADAARGERGSGPIHRDLVGRGPGAAGGAARCQRRRRLRRRLPSCRAPGADAGTSSWPSSCAAWARRRPITFEIFDDAVLRRANELSFGRHQLPTLDLAHTRYLVSFGADLLGTWNSPLAHGVAYGAMRQGRPGVRPKFVQVEPRMSQTGASADEWLAVRARHRRRAGARPGARDRRGRPAAGCMPRAARARSSTAGRRDCPPSRPRPWSATPACRPRASSGWPGSLRRTARPWR